MIFRIVNTSEYHSVDLFINCLQMLIKIMRKLNLLFQEYEYKVFLNLLKQLILNKTLLTKNYQESTTENGNSHTIFCAGHFII